MALLKMNFLSKSLGMQTNITVILPSFSFADIMDNTRAPYQEGMKFQTLWLLHGGSGDDADWTNFTSLIRYADANKLAVVMPSGGLSSYTDMVHGGNYFTFITEELVKVCRSFFPLSSKREDNFIGGLSMGGGGTMRLSLLRPDLYSAAICLSAGAATAERVLSTGDKGGPPGVDKTAMPFPSNFAIYGENLARFDPERDDMIKQAKRNADQKLDLPRYFFAVGDKDFARDNCVNTCQALTDFGYQTQLEVVPGYGHEWDFWDLMIRKAIYEWLPLKRTPIIGG